LAVLRPVPRLGRHATFYNVRCRKPGPPGAPRRIVCAHFDSRTERPSDHTSRAPGANDNGTGIAVLLELARLIQGISLPETIEFVATSGEEQDLWGSTDYAADLEHSGAEVSFMLNLDEVGFPNEGGEVVVEHDIGNKVPTNDADSIRLASEVAYIATRDLAIPTKRDEINNSDYMPFEAHGYVTIGLYESGDYDEFRHSSRDTIKQVKFHYVADVARVALVALLRDFRANPAAAKRTHKPGIRSRSAHP
jgi:Zn-dependent M28 family amino/carboxypeptidase